MCWSHEISAELVTSPKEQKKIESENENWKHNFQMNYSYLYNS